MTPERWQEVKKVLAGALERTPEQRRVHLNQACTDPDLRREVESLIAAHEQGDGSITSTGTGASLQKGVQLGHYTILTPIGSGGMGEVYRAHDPKLKRDVAIKVLPAAFVRDPERLSRFQREARLLAAPNHPNIAAIYGVEDSGATHALVMELAEGPTLTDRIHQGPIPIDEAIPIARQMAEALEYAHEHGIIHRDLKPANVKVSPDDTVKILDFGLAKALETKLSAEDIANSPTISQMATKAGVLLGTAAYMSPEQAKAKPVDRRADIWAFGCALYEMLTGQRAFRGDTVADTLAAVLEERAGLVETSGGDSDSRPSSLATLLAERRDARIALEEILSDAPEPAAVGQSQGVQHRLWLVSGIACLFVLATALLTFLNLHQEPHLGQSVRFEISLPENLKGGGAFRISPDGSKLAFIAAGEDGRTRLWVRSLDAVDAHPLDGTEGALMYPTWSPDSRSIAFWADGKVNRISVSGGPPQMVCSVPQFVLGAWTPDDKIVFGSGGGIMQVSALGGSPFFLTTERYGASLSLLPDGRHFVYMQESEEQRGHGIYVASLDTGPEAQLPKKLLDDFTAVAYAPSSDPAVGYLLFVRGATGIGGLGTLMAQRLDTRRLDLTGKPISIAENVSNNGFSASATGVLVYMARGSPGIYRTLALSPDGKRLAFERTDPKTANVHNIWLYDFARGSATRFTFDSAWDSNPVWSPDGSQIAFGSNRGGEFDLYEKDANLLGQDELLFKSAEHKLPSSWSPDGRALLYYNPTSPRLSLLSVRGSEADRNPVLMERSDFNQIGGSFSPDGRWIAYLSDESGRNEIYVRSFDISGVPC
jgi:serine/threonine protein kinase/Tol biopolymer transport system component